MRNLSGTRMRRLAALGALGLLIAALASACGADPTATPTPRPTSTPVPQQEATPTPDAMAMFDAEWDALVAAAQEEGEVVIVMGGSASRNYRPVVAEFEKKYGITATVSTGSGGAQTDRVLAEQSAGRYDVDVLMIGGTSALRLIAAEALVPIPPLLIHPEVTSGEGWFQGRVWYSDAATQQYVVNHSAAASPENLGMRYNTNLVTQADLDGFNSVFDYLDPKWANQIVSIPAIAEGAGGTYSTIISHPDIGEEFMERFVDPEFGVTFSTDFRFITDSLAGGKFAMGIGIGSAGRDLDELAEQGGPADRLIKPFKERDTLSGGGAGDNVQMPINAPNPNAAQLFLNWFLTKEGQTAKNELSEGTPTPSLREDIPCAGVVDPRECREPGKGYIYLTGDPEYTQRTEESLERAREIHRAARGG